MTSGYPQTQIHQCPAAPCRSGSNLDLTAVSMAGLLVIATITIIAGMVAHRKYRAALLRQQIDRLEQIWQLSAQRKSP
jgi:hypothetical protein